MTMTDATTDPYASAHGDYWDAGWRSVLPLPYRAKKSPPEGYTGYAAAEPSYADLSAWAMDGPQNIALRLPPGVIGLDVDAYGGKPGARTLADLVAANGPLPPTWLSSSRGDGISGIRLFRLPEASIRLITALPGIELIQAHHRYVVAAPSIHPDTGASYVWVDETTGTVGDEVPVLADLPMLPAAWVEALAVDGDAPMKADLDANAVIAVLAQMPRGEPCHHVLAAAGKAIGEGNRHDTYNSAVLAVVGAGRRGCPGALAVLTRMQATFIAEVTTVAATKRTRAEAIAEWDRSLSGAVAMVADEAQGSTCPDDWMEWVTGETAADPVTDDAEPEDEAAFAYRQAVARKAADLQLMEDAREILASRKAGKAPDLTAHPLGDFLAQPDEVVPWRIERLWPVNGRVLLAAAAKAGKTTMVMNLLKALADGGRFLGCFDVDPLPDGQVVVYLNMEVSPAQIRRWLRRAGIVNTDAIHVVNLRGQASALTLETEQGRQRVADWLRSLDAGMVILDPLAPLLAALGFEENDNSQVARFFSLWAETLALAGVTDDLIVHHTGHAGQRSRGAARFLDEPDALWTISKDTATDEDGDDVYEAQEPRFFKATGRDVEQAEQPLLYDGADGVLTLGEGSRKAIRAEAKHQRAQAAILARLREGQATQNDITRRLGINYSDAKATLDTLVDEGTVIRSKVGQAAVYRLGAVADEPVDNSTDTRHRHRHQPLVSVTDTTPIGGVGTSPVADTEQDGTDRTCERCGKPTGAAGARYCRDCAAASLRGEDL